MNEHEPASAGAVQAEAVAAELAAQPDAPQPETVAPLSPDAILGQMSAEQRSLSVFGGVVGALLGCIPGVLLWIVLGQVGFIAGISGWLMIRGANFGYSKLAGGIDRRGQVISIVIALLMPIVSEYLGLGVTIYRAFHDSYGVTLAEAIRSVPLYLAEQDVIQSMIFTLIIGYVLIAFGNIRISPGKKRDAQTPSL